MQTLTITRPDDWHLHLRDGQAMKDALVHTSGVFARAIVMPNLNPPVTRTDQARAYRERIVAALAPGHRFEPLMTLYLTDATAPAEIRLARDSGLVACGQAVSGRRDDEFRQRSDRPGSMRIGASGHAGPGRSAAGARRDDGPGGGRVRIASAHTSTPC